MYKWIGMTVLVFMCCVEVKAERLKVREILGINGRCERVINRMYVKEEVIKALNHSDMVDCEIDRVIPAPDTDRLKNGLRYIFRCTKNLYCDDEGWLWIEI